MDSKTIAALITAHRTGDEERFHGLVLQLIAHAHRTKHLAVAQSLESALHRPVRAEAVRLVRTMAATAPPGVSVEACPDDALDALVLDPAPRAVLQRILDEYAQRERLAAHGLTPCRSLFLYGPPGCGKTSIARALAGALDRPLHVVQIDGVVGSYLGETARSIRGAFEYAAKVPSVLFLDEIDAIAKDRADSQDIGEARRIVNSLLQILDAARREDVLVIAATNADVVIDRAVWRRFEVALPVHTPSTERLVAYLRARFDRMGVAVRDAATGRVNDPAWLTETVDATRAHLSVAGFERVTAVAAKSAVLRGDATISTEAFRQLLDASRDV